MGRGCEGLMDRAIRYSAMRLQKIGGQGFKVTEDWWTTKFEPKGCRNLKKAET